MTEPQLGRGLAVLVRALAVTLLCGCTAILDFDDCSKDSDCTQFGPGLVCKDKRCVAPGVGPSIGTYGDLLAFPCTRVYGVSPEDDYDPSTIILGTLLPASGALATYGPPIDAAVELAVEEINQAGGVFGRTLAVVSCDSGTDVEQAKLAATHLAEVAKVPAVVGAAASSITIEVFTKVAKQQGMLMISPASTSPALTNLPDDGLLWRTAPSDAIQGQAIAEYLLAEGFRNVAIILRDDAYGTGLRDAIFDNLCGEAFNCDDDDHLFTRSYGADTEADDQSSAIIDMGAQGFQPDVIVLIGFTEDGIAFMNLAQKSGYKRFVLTDGTKSNDLIAGVPADVTCQAIGTAPAAPQGTAYQTFALRYESRWKEEPGAFNAHAYDATYLLGYAMAASYTEGAVTGAELAAGLARLSSGVGVEAGSGPWNATIQQLRNNPEATVDFNGASGALNFNNQTGEALSSIEGWYFNLVKGEVESLGVIFTEAGVYKPPDLTESGPVCEEAPPGGGT